MADIEELDDGGLEGGSSYLAMTDARLNLYRTFLDSFQHSSQSVREMREDVEEVRSRIDVVAAELEIKCRSARTALSRLSEYQKEIREKEMLIATIEVKVGAMKLDDHEKERLSSINDNLSVTDLAASVRRLVESDRDDQSLMENVTEKITLWFDANIITCLDNDPADLSLATITRFLITTHGFPWLAEKYVEKRASIVRRLYAESLSVGSPTAKPIEMHAHNPVRYTSDLLAWIHQAYLGEVEILDDLLGDFVVGEGRELAGRIVTPTALALKDRIEAVANSVETLSVTFHLLLIVEYYHDWFSVRCPPIASILSTDTFRSRITLLFDALYTRSLSLPANPQTLQPTPALLEIISEMEGMEQVYRMAALGRSSTYEEVVGEEGAGLLVKVMNLYRAGLEEDELDILRINTLSRMSFSLPILEQVKESALERLTQHSITRLLLAANIQQPADDAFARKLSEFLSTLSSGWQLADPRIAVVAGRMHVEQAVTKQIMQMYSDTHNAEDASQKSPETILLLLSQNH